MGRALTWSFAGEALSKIAVLGTALVAARSLTPVRFGAFIGLSATALLAAAAWDCGFSYLLTRECASGVLQPRAAVKQAVRPRLALFPVWLVMFVLGMHFVYGGPASDRSSVIGFAGASLLFGTSSLFLGTLRGQMRFAAAGTAIAAGRWATAALSLLAFLAPSVSRLLVLGLAFMAGEGITLALAAASSGRSRSGEKPGEPRLSIRMAMPFAVNSLLGMAYNRFDVVILAALSTAFQLSLYAPASRIQDALYLLPSTIGIVSLPAVAGAWGANSSMDQVRELTRRLLVLGMVISVPLTVVVFVFAPPIIRLVLGGDYNGAVGPTRILVLFLPLACLQAPLLGALAGIGRAQETTKVFAMAFLTALGMHASLDWWLGGTGAAIASLAREPVALTVAVLLARRYGLLRSSRSPARRKPSVA